MPAVERPVVKPRPVYLNLLAIRQPLPAIVSILHRDQRRAAVPRRHPARAVPACRRASRRRSAIAAIAGDVRASARPSSCCSALVWAYRPSPARRHPPPGRSTSTSASTCRRARQSSADRARRSALLLDRSRSAVQAMVSRTYTSPVGAHYGLARLAGRSAITAVVMALYTLPRCSASLLWHGGFDYATWKRDRSRATRSASRRSCSWRRCCGTRGSACATS